MDPADPSPPTALSKAQHKASLWADPALRVYAVVMADRMPSVATLTAAQVPAFDCLLPGVLTPAAARAAPYLLQLDPKLAFTDWLLFEAGADLGDWGTLVQSPSDFVPLRNRLRGFCEARLVDGSVVPLAWMDPTLLRCLLPMLDGMQLSTLFSGVTAFGVAEAGRLTLYRAPLGRLAVDAHAIAA